MAEDATNVPAPLRAKIFGGLAIGFFLVTGYLILRPEEWSHGRAAAALIAASACAVFSALHQIKSFEISPASIKAQMKEVERVVEEAEATLRQLHLFAETSSAMIVDQLTGGGRLGGFGADKVDEMRQRIESGLEAIGLERRRIDEVMAADRRWVAIDYSLGVLHRMRKMPGEPNRVAGEALRKWNDEDFRPTPDELAAIVAQAKVTDDHILGLVEDYRHYDKTRKHRRPEVWRGRKDWLRP